ncbi:MAG: 3-keto-5-aminohexanoate cleavage protein [Saprospiraceae bacterium]|nr:3-keto-5-aminohexanoate cleavage protein [Saprospiraceae bacterium]
MTDLIINYTPTGMVPMKSDNPHVPLSVSEIIEDVHAAYELGITLVHLHARHPQTFEPDYRLEVYGPILEGVRSHCPDLVCGVSLSGRNFNEFSKRAEPLQLQPDLASLTLSSLNFARQASVNAPDMVQELLAAIYAHGAQPELEVFDLGMINYAQYLLRKGLLKDPLYFNLLFGNIATMQTRISHLSAVLDSLPEGAWYAFAGIGDAQLTMHLMAMGLGAGVRVGLEDNLYFDARRERLATNLDLLHRVHQLAELAERPIMTSRSFGEAGFYNSLRTKSQYRQHVN